MQCILLGFACHDSGAYVVLLKLYGVGTHMYDFSERNVTLEEIPNILRCRLDFR